MARRVESLSPKAIRPSRRRAMVEGDTGARVPAVLAALKTTLTSPGSSITLLWLESFTSQTAWLTRSLMRNRDCASTGAAANRRASVDRAAKRLRGMDRLREGGSARLEARGAMQLDNTRWSAWMPSAT